MNAKAWPLLVAILLSVPLPARAQVTEHTLPSFAAAKKGAPGEPSHEPPRIGGFLTHGQVDRWSFEGEKGETIIVHVSSKEFDPVVGLSRTQPKEDEILIEVNDEGNQGSFVYRLPEKGQYKIRIHALKFQGGGNFTMRVQRFQAKPLTLGKAMTGTFDRDGRSYLSFQATRDQILIPELKGAASEGWRMLDYKGRVIEPWSGAVLIEDTGKADAADCSLLVFGEPEQRYELVVRVAGRHDLVEGKPLTGNLDQGEMDVISFEGKPSEFRLLEVEKKGELTSRLKYAPLKATKERVPAGGETERPAIVYLPVASRGGRLRFAATLGRKGRYQLQLLARTSTKYTLTASDPTVPMDWGKDAAGSLPVSGTAFYGFKAKPGQLFQANLASTKFAPLLRLFDMDGAPIASSGDDVDGLESRITHMVVKEGQYRLQVCSLGDGGGGDFRLGLTESKLKELPIGGRGQGTIQPGVTDFWVFPGDEGKTVFVNARSKSFEPAISIRSPDGVQLAADNHGNTATGNLIALRLPKTGRYTLWISSQRGAGDYGIRLIDGD